ncbi:MAG: hypothetical protein ACFE0P_03035 [Oceanicaulis sp.]
MFATSLFAWFLAMQGAGDADTHIFGAPDCPFEAAFPAPFIRSRLPDGGALATQRARNANRSALCSTSFRSPDATTPCQDVYRISSRIEAPLPDSDGRWLIAETTLCVREIEAISETKRRTRFLIAAAGDWVFIIEEVHAQAGLDSVQFRYRDRTEE